MPANGNNRINFQVGFNADKSNLNQIQQAFKKILDIKPADFSGTKKQLVDIKKQAINVSTALNKAFNADLNSINFSTFKKQLGNLNLGQVYTDFNKLGAVGKNAFQSMAGGILTTNLNLKQTSNFIQNIGTTLMNTAKWTVASGAIRAFTSSISQAFSYVKSLDSSLNDIRIVTKDSADEMANFAAQANRAATELGRSTLDYTKAALTFYQQGLDNEAVAARTEATLKAQNITGAGSEMADYLTAVWNGYKVANEQAELYVDKLAAVADSSASNMSQLAVAMSKVASTANMLGVPIDKLNAQIATIVATTRQAPESVGNALKTIYARINDIATGADDAEISLGNYSKKMLEVGISVLDANGKLRDTGDVIDEIGEKWGSLSRQQQIYLARTMAGQRQYNNLLALFENWSNYTNLVNVSLEAQGATAEKNSIYLESLAAHTEKLGAAQQRLKSSLVDSESYKNLLDVATSGITLMANFIQSIGGGGNALLALGSIATQVFSGIIAKEINNVITNMQNAKANSEIIAGQIQALSEMTRELDAVNGNSIATDRLNQIKTAYSSITDQVRQQYNQLVLIEIQEKNKLESAKEQLNLATRIKEKLAEKVENFGISQYDIAIDNIQQALDRASEGIKKFNLNANNIKNSKFLDPFIRDLKIASEEIGNTDQDLLNLITKLENAQKNGFRGYGGIQQLSGLVKSSTKEVNKLQFALNNTTDDNFDKLNATVSEYTVNANRAKSATDRAAQSINSGFDIQNIVRVVGAIGQVTSGIYSLINVFKVWENDSLSTGEKVLQFFTNLSFTIPMILNGILNLKTSLENIAKINNYNIIRELQAQITKQKALQVSIEKTQKLNSQITKINTQIEKLNQEKITLEKKAQLNLERAINIEKENAILAEIYLNDAVEDEKKAKAINLKLEQRKEAVLRRQLLLQREMTSQQKLQNTETGTGLVGESAKKALKDASGFGAGISTIFSKIKGGITSLGGLIAKAFTLHPYISAFTGLGVIIGGIVTAVALMPSELEEAQEKAAQLAEKAKIAKQNYQSINNEITNLSSSMSSLSSATEALNQLASGTEQWRSKLAEVNQLVLDLIEKYPILKSYLNFSNDGRLTIGEGGWEAVLDELEGKRRANAVAAAVTTQNSADQNNRTTRLTAVDRLNSEYDRDLSVEILSDYIELISQYGTDFEKISEALSSSSDLYQQHLGNLAFQLANDDEKFVGQIIALTNKLQDENRQNANYLNGLIQGSFDFTSFEGFEELTPQLQEIFKNAFTYAIKNLNQSSLPEDYFDQGSLDFDKVLDKYKSSLPQTVDDWEEDDGIYTFYNKAGEQILSESKEGIIAAVATLLNGDQDIAKQMFQQISSLNKVTPSGTALAGSKVNEFGTLEVNLNKDNLTIQDLQNIIDNAEELAIVLGVSTDEIMTAEGDITSEAKEQSEKIKTEAQKAKDQIAASLALFINSLSPSVREAFQNLTDGKELTEAAQKQLGNILQKAFNKGLDLSLVKDFVEDLDSEQLGKLSTLNFDYNTGTVDQLKEALNNAGISTIATDEALQQYINSQKAAKEATLQTTKANYKTIHDIVDKLKNNDTISEEDAKKLKTAGLNLDEYFDPMLDGTYKLKVSAKDFYEYANNQSLQGFKKRLDQVNGLIGKIGRGETLSGSAYSGQTTDPITGESFTTYDHQKLEDQLAILNVLGQESKERQQIIDKVKKHQELTKDEVDLIGKQFDGLGDIKDVYKNLTNQQKSLIKGLKQVGKTIDKDVNTEKLTNLTQYFNTRHVEGFAPIFQADFQAAQDLAEELLRFDHALSDVKTNYQSWKTTLNSGSVEQIALVLPDIANAYSDLLGIDPSVLGDGFLRNTKNLQLFNQVLNGTDEQAIDAYNQLQELALMQIIPKVALQDKEFKNRVDQIIQMSNQLQASDIEVGATINNQDFIDGVNEILAAAATTKDQAQAILEQLGVEANVIPTEQVSIVGTTQIPTYRVQYKNPVAKGGQTSPDDANGGLEFQYIPTGTKTIYNTTKMRGWKIVAGKKGNTPYNKVKSSPTRSTTKSDNNKGGGSTPTPTHVGPTAKPQTPDKKEQIYNPYEKVNRSLERQSNLLDQLQDQEDNLTGKDRLKNLEKQNDVLKKQNSLLKTRQQISNDPTDKGSTAWYRTQLKDLLGNKIKFDSDGQISNVTDATNAATNQYNKAATAAYSKYQKAWKAYQDWRVKYNQLSADKQAEADKKALKSLSKEQKTNALEVYGMQLKTAEDVHNYLLKVAEDRYNDTIKKLQEQHDTTLQYLEQYQNKWKEDFDARQQYFENVRQIIENELGRLQIKVDVSIDRGQLEREWLDFEEKYIKNIKDTDYTKRAQAALKQMGSYADSEQLQEMMTAIRNGRTSLNRLNGTSKQQKAEVLDILGYSEGDWAEWTAAQRSDAVNRAEKIVKQNLQTNLKSIQDALIDVREKANQIREIWLSTYDQLNDDMGKTIEQYERVGSIIDHNAKLSQMIFGDEAYASALKYQQLQQDNNKEQMKYLVDYRDKWLKIYNKNKDVDEELAAKALENYQNYASQVEAMTETMIQNLGQQWQTTAQNALKKFRNNMRLSYANTEWDAINKYDEAFLDPVETKFNLAEIERLYNDAADSVSDNKDEQARINKLLQEQMKILKNKQNLTQYDIDRAKAQLEIEQARYALEDARNQKTTMRLRRDSQGNYTYQYVANEQQIEDTQAKYAQATYDLYEKDKQHYKKTLNDMNSLTQDYMDRRLELEQKLRQAQATQSKAQINRIQKQIDKYDEWYNKISQGFIEDNAVLKDNYLVQSYSLDMGLDPDSTNVIKDMTKNLDYFGTSMQTFVNKVAGSGGLVDALAGTFDTINKETSTYITKIGQIAKSLNEGYSGQGLGFLSNILNPNATHVIKDNIEDAKTVAEETSTAVANTEKIINNVSTMLKEAENFIEVLNNQNNVIQELLKAYKEIQQANDFSGKDETTTQGTGLTSSRSTESVTNVKNKISSFAKELTDYLESLFPPNDTAKAATGGYTGEWDDGGKLAYLHQKELVLNEIDTANILAAASIVKGITSSMNLDGSLIDMMAQQGTLFNSLTTQHDILDQNVHIDATFPNVTDHLEIERAFNNLVNVASMYASRKES